MSRSLDHDAGLTRRRLLATGGGLVVGFCFARPLAAAVGSDAPGADEVGPKSVAPDEVDAFLSIARDGRATIFSGKVELGTGVATALTQIAAEELDLPVARVDLVQGDTALTPDQGVTYGSLSIQVGGVQLRQAAATARAALLRQAAAELDAPLDDLTLADGVVRARSSGRQVTYGALIGGRNLSLKLDPHAAPKPPSDYKLVGTSVARLDIPAKVVGQFTYMQDVRLPGMLHGRPIRPPAIGAMLRDVHERFVRSIPGNVRVVRAGDFLAVVADTEWAAIQGAQQLKARWTAWAGLPEQSRLWDHVRATRVVRDDVTSNIGDVSVALPQAARRISASYDFAIHTHGSIGPSCAVAVFEKHKLTCWSASQGPHALRRQLAEMMGMPQADVRVIYVEGAGCYGRNGHEDAAADAALLARATGRPVRVQWMRQDEHGWDPKGPPTLIDLEGGLTAADDVVAWRSAFFTPDGSAGNVPLIAASLAGMPHETTMSPGKILGDSAIPYSFPNIRTVAHRLADTPLRPSWIRTPGRMQNTFANECFIDELAAAANADPLEFRLRHLNDSRGAELLHRLARAAKWQPRPSPQRQYGSAASSDIVTGRGVAYVKYELVRTYVGAVAEVEVNRRSGEIRTTRFVVAQDCGQIINPDGVRNQIEGNVLQTVSRVLKEEVTFDRSTVTSLDWASYPILTFPEIPEVEIELIDRPSESPWGSGEPSAAVIPSAISNAVFDATGVRLRSVPFTPAKAKEALRGA